MYNNSTTINLDIMLKLIGISLLVYVLVPTMTFVVWHFQQQENNELKIEESIILRNFNE